MRRDSHHTVSLQSALSDHGVHVGGRRLEAWSAAGLGPLAPTSLDEQVSHYAAVAELSGSGRDDDRVALRLAARGFACPRLRPTLLRRSDLPEAPPEASHGQLDLLSESSSEDEFDGVFVEVEAAAQNLLLVESQQPLLHRMLSALRQNAAKHSRALSQPTEGLVHPSDVVHSSLVSLAWYMRGGEAYNTKAWAAMADVDPSEVGTDFEAFAEALRPDLAACEDAYRHMPLDRITSAAKYLADHAPGFLPRFGLPPVPMAELEEACSLFAPWAACTFELVVPRLTGLGMDEQALIQAVRDVFEGTGGEAVELVGKAPSTAQPQPSIPAT